MMWQVEWKYLSLGSCKSSCHPFIFWSFLVSSSERVCCQKALPCGDSWRRRTSNGDTTPVSPAINDGLLTATATQDSAASDRIRRPTDRPTAVRTQRHLFFSPASGSAALRQSVLLSVATLELGVRGSLENWRWIWRLAWVKLESRRTTSTTAKMTVRTMLYASLYTSLFIRNTDSINTQLCSPIVIAKLK